MKSCHFFRFSRSEERGVRSEITCKLLMVVLLIVQCSMLNVAKAQTEPEAFFIYRNDGDFDGFFYDRVLRMNFSKIGIDSVEYDYYVVQEIETPDSIYRIPLAAIDSIGFQQPEIRFSPKLKNMDELGITPYVTEARGWAYPSLFRPTSCRRWATWWLVSTPTSTLRKWPLVGMRTTSTTTWSRLRPRRSPCLGIMKTTTATTSS